MSCYNADYNASQLPAGKLSTKGVGLTAPNSAHFRKLDNGCVVPCGAAVQAETSRTPTLQYNEYIGRSACGHGHGAAINSLVRTSAD